MRMSAVLALSILFTCSANAETVFNQLRADFRSASQVVEENLALGKTFKGFYVNADDDIKRRIRVSFTEEGIKIKDASGKETRAGLKLIGDQAVADILISEVLAVIARPDAYETWAIRSNALGLIFEKVRGTAPAGIDFPAGTWYWDKWEKITHVPLYARRQHANAVAYGFIQLEK